MNEYNEDYEDHDGEEENEDFDLNFEEAKPLPQCFVHQLNEMTSGGFIYFRINETGDVEPVYCFDNEVCMLALVGYATKMLRQMDILCNKKVQHEFLDSQSDE